MATVNGFTAAHMQAIKDGTIVNASIVGGELILTRYDASTVNLGTVIGADGADGNTLTSICTSTTRPASPVKGQHIYETDTGKKLMWYGATTGWEKPWYDEWGIIDVKTSSIDVTRTIAGDISGGVMSSLKYWANRRYKFTMNATVKNTAVGVNEFIIELVTGASGIGSNIGNLAAVLAVGETQTPYRSSVIWSQISTVTQQLHARMTYLATNGFVFLGSARSETVYTIEDMGPTGNPPSA